MKLETFETLLLLLLFVVPGIVFLYTYSRAFSPSERARYIQEQFPFELTLLYLASSAIIHSFLLVVLLASLNLINWCFHIPDIISKITTPLLSVTSATIDSLTLSVAVVVTYFAGSLILAYFIGRWWARQYVPAIPMWCRELVELRAASLKSGEPARLELLLHDGRKLEGEWHSFSLLGGKQSLFEIAIRQAKKNLLIWIPANNISEMDATVAEKTVKLIFGQMGDVDSDEGGQPLKNFIPVVPDH